MDLSFDTREGFLLSAFQVEQNVEFVQKKRDDVAFSPKDHESVDLFLQVLILSYRLNFHLFSCADKRNITSFCFLCSLKKAP